jgi:hypothetical protein
MAGLLRAGGARQGYHAGDFNDMKTQEKRIMAVGCSHGIYADETALDAVLRFKEKWKPDVTIHLGDFIDATALRSGAHGTNDEDKPIEPDVDGGLNFLKRLRPNVVLFGNHEDRLQRLMDSHNAVVSYAAQRIYSGIIETLSKLKCKVLPYTGIEQGYMIGGVRYMHGVFYNEMAVRDHAETFGPCVFAHTHRAGVATGRRSDRPKGYCVGTLTRMGAMEYAKCRRSTLGWSQGFLFGVYSNNYSQLWLHEQPDNSRKWILPMV